MHGEILLLMIASETLPVRLIETFIFPGQSLCLFVLNFQIND